MFKILFKLVLLTWEYSKTKIGHNFLPGLARCNLNADLSLSVLTLTFWRWKKTISNLKIVNLWCFPNLLISGRCWRNDARTCPQRQTKSTRRDVRGQVRCRDHQQGCDVTWRDVDGVMDWRRLRSDSSIANPAKTFYYDMIWELYCS